MSKPTPKQNFLQTALIMITIFLGIQLFMGSRNQPQDTSTLPQLEARLIDQNQHLRSVDIIQTKNDYEKKIDLAVTKKALSAAEGEEKKVEAAVLVADAQLKEGMYRDSTSQIRLAYQTLIPFEKRLVDTPAWNKQVAIPTPVIPGPAIDKGGNVVAKSQTKFEWNSLSGQQLYQKIVDDLTARNHTDLVYGFIPGYGLMDFLVHLTGANPNFSYAFAAFLLAFVVRAVVYPLSQKQLMFSRQMSQLGPLTAEIKLKYKGDTAVQQQKVMELYKEYGINPMAGCFPALIQMPLFLTVYQCMLCYQFQFQHGVFLWINPAMSKATHAFIGHDLGQQDYILIMIYGITMVIATLLTPVTDPSQVKQQRLMGVGVSIIFTFFMFTGAFPVVSGFVLYWVFTNILATTQSLRAYRMPLPPLVKLSAAGGGMLPRPASKWQQMMDKMMEEQQRKAKKRDNDKGGGCKNGKEKRDDSSSSNGSTSSKIRRVRANLNLRGRRRNTSPRSGNNP